MTVGCGRHQAVIADRGGSIVSRLDVLVSVEWNRVLDDSSTATVTVQPDGDCCAELDRVRTWRHRLDVYRDGAAVWSGPVLKVEWEEGEVVITAGDILAWQDRRVPHKNMRFTGADLADVAAALIDDGFAPDDPGHSVEIVAYTGITGDRAYSTDVGQTGDHLRDLAKTGLDYTAVGSKILLMGEDFCDRVGSLTDADFPTGLSVVEDGASLATRVIVHGTDPVKGEAGGYDDYYGLLELVDDETSILDDHSAGKAAESRLRASSPAPVFLDSQQATLSPDAAVDVPSLVPGWCVDITTTRTCRNIGQSLKILSLKVTEDGDGETVGIQLAPAGT